MVVNMGSMCRAHVNTGRADGCTRQLLTTCEDGQCSQTVNMGGEFRASVNTCLT